jgi:ketose-bisphosphate aldolase
MWNARRAGTAIPAFNIPFLPMMEAVVEALRDTDCLGLIAVARLEWTKFQARSVRAIYLEYQRVKDERFTRLHLDHVPVIDEDNLRVDYEAVIQGAIQLGYQSVMVDGSRLPLQENIEATRKVARLAHAAGIALEGELGAVFGHEAGPLPPYEELFASGKGFTAAEDARRFVQETGVDWLSVAVGNVHGAISDITRHDKKVEARLNIEHLERIYDAVQIPLVLHGGSGIKKRYIQEAIRHGIAKINIGTAIRQPYELALKESPQVARKAAYEAAVRVVSEELELQGSRRLINPEA